MSAQKFLKKKIQELTKEEQMMALELAAKERGYNSFAEYAAAELDYSNPVYDE